MEETNQISQPESPKTFFDDPKKLSILGAVVVILVLAGLSVYYFLPGGAERIEDILLEDVIYETSEFDITCKRYESWSQEEKDEYQVVFNDIFGKDEITENELAKLLPIDCSISLHNPEPNPGSCLVLQEEFCGEYEVVEYNGEEAYAFNLPYSTPIFSPLAEESVFVEAIISSLGYSVIELRDMNDGVILSIVGNSQPRIVNGSTVGLGDWIIATKGELELIEGRGDINTIFYAEGYDVGSLFE